MSKVFFNFNYGNYPDLNGVKRILVIKLRHLGDVLLSAPVLSNLKKAMPDAEIDAYIWEEAAPMYEGHPALSNLILQDRKWKKLPFLKRFYKELGLLRHIHVQKYDLIINLTEGDRGALAALASGASLKVGFDPGRQGFLGKRKLYTHLVKHCPNPRHSVERDLDALRRIGIFPTVEEKGIELIIPGDAKASMRSFIQSENLVSGSFILIHAVSRWRFKCLPPKLIAKVIDQLDLPVILTGGPSEQEGQMLQEIVDFANAKMINLGGKTSLKELGALMQLSQGLITVDSVALHMASALKLPVVALFGPTSEQNWGPWQHPNSIVVAQKLSCRPCRLDGCGGSKRSDCLWSLAPNKIVDAYKKIAHSSKWAIR